MVAGVVTSGLPGGLLALGVAALLVGLGAVVAGRARWAFVASRGVGGAVLAAGLAAVVVGGVTAPRTEPTATSAPASTSAAATGTSSAAERSAAAEAQVAAAEDALEQAETSESAVAPVDPATGLLSDTAADAAVGTAAPATALAALAAVPVQGRAPRTGYDRDLFGAGWVDTDRNGCDTRNDVLARDLTGETFKPATRGCVVLTGTLADPYSGATIAFRRGQTTSDDVQIDHVVALSDAWQKGAQQWDTARRTQFANDPLNLLAVDGPLNLQKGDGDAATWLPPARGYRCAYVARQVAVKVIYGLWTTQAERNAIATVLSTCPGEPLPGGVVAPVARTAAPTTTAPATAAPSTAAPSTAAPTTAPPTTGRPTTAAPVPSTQRPRRSPCPSRHPRRPCSRTCSRPGPRARARGRAGVRQLHRGQGGRGGTDPRRRPGLGPEVRPGRRRGRLRVVTAGSWTPRPRGAGARTGGPEPTQSASRAACAPRRCARAAAVPVERRTSARRAASSSAAGPSATASGTSAAAGSSSSARSTASRSAVSRSPSSTSTSGRAGVSMTGSSGSAGRGPSRRRRH
ncbi:HNH endonuclease family protein [Geodermatophilus normandii]|uniref:HNH endonuclease family protein n=1 Tax=Geodermatophilus normandii TaxID=1137989 RepID=UPI003CCC4FB0